MSVDYRILPACERISIRNIGPSEMDIGSRLLLTEQITGRVMGRRSCAANLHMHVKTNKSTRYVLVSRFDSTYPISTLIQQGGPQRSSFEQGESFGDMLPLIDKARLVCVCAANESGVDGGTIDLHCIHQEAPHN